MDGDRVMTWLVFKLLKKFGKVESLDISVCLIDDSALIELKERSPLFHAKEDKVLAVHDR